jgi:hypothetical protein
MTNPTMGKNALLLNMLSILNNFQMIFTLSDYNLLIVLLPLLPVKFGITFFGCYYQSYISYLHSVDEIE